MPASPHVTPERCTEPEPATQSPNAFAAPIHLFATCPAGTLLRASIPARQEAGCSQVYCLRGTDTRAASSLDINSAANHTPSRQSHTTHPLARLAQCVVQINAAEISVLRDFPSLDLQPLINASSSARLHKGSLPSRTSGRERCWAHLFLLVAARRCPRRSSTSTMARDHVRPFSTSPNFSLIQSILQSDLQIARNTASHPLQLQASCGSYPRRPRTDLCAPVDHSHRLGDAIRFPAARRHDVLSACSWIHSLSLTARSSQLTTLFPASASSSNIDSWGEE
jgi:hypothetical protein